jgi:hypothetical protein
MKADDMMFCCKYHWKRIPDPIRQAVSLLYHQYKYDEIGHAEYMRSRQAAMDTVNGVPPSPSGPDPGTTCKSCRQLCVRAVLPVTGERVLLSLVRNEAARTMLGDQNMLCVVGGTAVAALGKGPQFARLVLHFCRGVMEAASNRKAE